MRSFNTPKDLLNEEDFKKYEEDMYPFNLKTLYNKLLEKLKEDPDYEVWVPLHYYQWENALKVRKHKELITPPSVIISNKGRVYDQRRKVSINVRTYGDECDHPFTIYYGKRVITFPVHRAIGCSFIPVGEEHGIAGYHELVINHLDGVKSNIELTNLEWTTQLGNNLHALQNELRFGCSGWENNRSIPAKGRILEGPHKGHEFILCGQKQCKASGFNVGPILECCYGKSETYRNCSWSLATNEDIANLPQGLGKDKFKTINFFKGNVKSRIKAICLTTGKTFIITRGMPEIVELGFRPSEVTSVINGKRKSHKGHTFLRV